MVFRRATLALLVVLALATGASAQQPQPAVAGRWEVSITGRTVRLLDLTVAGTTVTGTLTREGADATTVIGELRKDPNRSGWSLNFAPKADDEFFTVIPDGEGLHGTYVDKTGKPEKWSKMGVVLKRPTLPAKSTTTR